MKLCGGFERVLGLASLASGLLAGAVLSISVAVDYWLLTDEPWTTDAAAAAPAGAPSGAPAVPEVTMFSTYSGLWRACIYMKLDLGPLPGDPGKLTTDSSTDQFNTDEEYVEPMDDPKPSCTAISYFDQSSERIEGGETSTAIWRGIRRSTPVIMLSLLLMISAEVLAVFGFLREDFRTVVGAVLSIIAALSLALGQIFYISAVNDEASQWKRPEGASEKQSFKYGYGWAFYSAGSSFIIVMVAAVGHITVYLRRYVTNDVRRMLIIVPGLNVRKIEAAAAANNNSNNVTVNVPPLPTSPLPNRRTPPDFNGASRAILCHGNGEEHSFGFMVSHVPTTAEQNLQPMSTSDPGSSFVGSHQIPQQLGSLSLDAVRRLPPMTNETEVQHYHPHHHWQYEPGLITSLQRNGFPTSGSRVQSDIF